MTEKSQPQADQDPALETPSRAGGTAERPVIIGVGASAGGIAPLQSLFHALPHDLGAAFVVIVHLDPDAHSELSSVLAARTRMPVVQVTGTEKLRPGHVYVIPPDRSLHITDHEVSAVQFHEPRGQRAPIDLLFRSIAEQHANAFAIILSGAGSDGALGVKAIKEAGGIILVQDPAEAEYPSMPRSAIATGMADVVLPIRELAERLVELVRNAGLGVTEGPRGVDEDLFRKILAQLRVRTGHDFSKYKRSTVLRRIARRMQVTRSEDLKSYGELLRDNPQEPEALLSDLLISVTTFFRDREVFGALQTCVLPQLFQRLDELEPIRVWVPGCATGEKAYTLAMLLLEEASRHELRPLIQIFASDLDARALATAREGRFPSAIEADVSDERLRRFFMREGDHYRVRQEVRDLILFATHNLLKDPPFSRIDLISCRNLLIYLERDLQQQVCSTFHYALKPGGYLLLGSSESADSPTGLFRCVDRKARIYQSTAHVGDKPRSLPRLLGTVAVGQIQDQHAASIPLRNPGAAISEALLHRESLEKTAPPSILVDRTHKAVHLSEKAGRYLQPSAGPLTGDVVDLVRPELRFDLRAALHRVLEHGQPTLSLPILVQFNGSPRRVHLQVKPVRDAQESQPSNAIIFFIDGEVVQPSEAAAAHQLGADDAVVRQLQEDLQLAQSRLRSTREDYEVTNEELRAANEELQSINEEYRSTSEELETSKEELQSINEELQTVNAELKSKLEAMSRAHSDLQNLMTATDVGTLFLDPALRIKRYTQPITELFRITPSDEGRPITDFAHQLEYDDLIRDARDVLTNLAPIKREIHNRQGRWYDMRLRPYRTVENKIDGVVITFLDITERLQFERALRDSEQHLRQVKRLIELSHDPMLIWDFDGTILEWNRGSEELYGYSREEALGKQKHQLLASAVPGSSFEEVQRALLAESSWTGEIRHRAKDGTELIVVSRIVLDSVGDRKLVLESTHNITERRQWEKRQQMLLHELTHRVKNTLAVVQAIAHQSRQNSSSPEDFVKRFEGRLLALASAHSLLVESNWTGADLKQLVSGQIGAYMPPERVRIQGEPITLPADVATPFALVLHELATNATKHGSLSRPEGSVTLTWDKQINAGVPGFVSSGKRSMVRQSSSPIAPDSEGS